MDDKQELLWRQYQLVMKTYRDYLELLLKINVFYYAVTGAILSYYFTHDTQPQIKCALLLPLLMSLAFLILFFGGARITWKARPEVIRVGKELGFTVAPEVAILVWLLIIFGILMGLVVLGLTYLILR